ncbi:MAG: serine/threonine protein phosphatase [Deltaproteobacteria bacterium]|nr:serine/threonine protein phosphatase [Deltaproteobacteria bacterium]
MEHEKIFIVGDIHGCLDMLKRMMDKIDWHPNRDRLIFLGDYIDRGMNSRGVVDFILEFSEISSHVQCLMGNHETLFLNYLEGGDIDTFLHNGGIETLDSYNRGGEFDIPPEHVSFFRSLHTMIELEDYYVVHAGLQPGVEITRQSQDDLIWIRDPFIFSDWDFGKKVIFGHTPFSVPLVMDNKIGLDTGAVFGNRLTCLELPDMIFHSVEARELG